MTENFLQCLKIIGTKKRRRSRHRDYYFEQVLVSWKDVNYFKNKLYEALNVPTTRLQADGAFNLGRASEITRDELKFSRFVGRLRTRFSEIFHIILERQLLLKGVITQAEWKEMQDKIYYDFMTTISQN